MKLSTFILGSTLALANARTITVKEGDSIQKALEQVKPGDTIKISDGTYFENPTRGSQSKAPEKLY